MSMFVSQAQSILDRYESKRRAVGLEFTPPDEEADLGEYAFPADVFEQIYMGVITGLLTEGVVLILHRIYYGVKPLFAGGKKDSEDITALVKDITRSSDVASEAIQKLRGQGVKTEQAQAAIDLLVETVQEEIVEKLRKADPPQFGHSESSSPT